MEWMEWMGVEDGCGYSGGGSGGAESGEVRWCQVGRWWFASGTMSDLTTSELCSLSVVAAHPLMTHLSVLLLPASLLLSLSSSHRPFSLNSPPPPLLRPWTQSKSVVLTLPSHPLDRGRC
jgi:hypothetical protein